MKNKDTRLKELKMIVTDVDGVLTDGKFAYYGKEEIKSFNVKDGLGLTLARLVGIKLAFLSGRDSMAVQRRAAELRIDHYLPGVVNKQTTLEELSVSTGLSLETTVYIGDDLNDIPAMEIAGWVATVNGAPDLVKGYADYVTVAKGGEGAVREIIEKLLKEYNLWDRALKLYLGRESGQ